MSVRETSLLAYKSVKKSLGQRQEKVLQTFIEKGHPCNNRMISEYMGVPINSVTPRVKELRELDLLERAGKSICPYSKRKTIFWKVKK